MQAGMNCHKKSYNCRDIVAPHCIFNIVVKLSRHSTSALPFETVLKFVATLLGLLRHCSCDVQPMILRNIVVT